MTHYMRLREAPFRKIAAGTKTYELRLFDEKRRQIAPGDAIVFTCTADEAVSVTVRVTELLRFSSFAELYKTLPLDACGYAPEEIATASPQDMEAYYTPEEQAHFGVVAIGIRLTDTI